MARPPGRFKARLGTSLKQLAEFFYPRLGYGGGLFLAPVHPGIDYAAEVGNGLLSSVVMPVVQFISRAFPEAPLVVRELRQDEAELVDKHPLVALVNRPNAYYPGTVLWMATILDWAWFGESYWRILQNRGGQPAELWWLPPWSIEPKWPIDGSMFIEYYEYRPELGTSIRLDLDEVLHFRHGLDPWNPRHGLPPLRSTVREIWADIEATQWVGALLRNMAIPGLVMSPKDADATLSPEEVERVQRYLQSRLTGDHRGSALAFGQPTDVHRLSWSPNEMDMTAVRNTTEERVCAALGIPAAVIGFGTGLENSKVGATMHEFTRLAWNNGIVPLQRLLAAELQRVLLPQFEQDTERFQVGWNYDEVQALEPDQNELAKRLDLMVRGGWLKVSEARQAMGYEANDEDEIYLRSPALQPVDPDDQMPEPEPLPLPTSGVVSPNGNGNGNGRRQLVEAEQRALIAKQGTLEEFIMTTISRHASRLDQPPRAMMRLAAKLWREEQKLLPGFQSQIAAILRRYGDYVAVAAREVVPTKQPNFDDLIQTAIITERVPLTVVRFELAEVYAAYYAQMAEMTATILQAAMDLPLTDTTALQAQVRMEARDRVRLLDLDNETRRNVVTILEQARVEEWTEEALSDALRVKVPSGRWSTPDIRAEIMARTESRFASNMATTRYAQQQGMGRVLVLDARLGPTDAECELRNGWVVSPAEAQALAGVEHPQGTLSLLPITAQMGAPA